MRGLWIALAVACSMPPEPAEEAPTRAFDRPLPHELGEHRELPERAALDPESICGRVEACCHAFAEATPHVRPEVACAEPAEVAELDDADARCRRMALGWRAALERHADRELPAACEIPPRRRRGR